MGNSKEDIMARNARLLVTAAATLALGMWFLTAAGRTSAADEGEVKGEILKLADVVANGDGAAAKKQAEEIGKKAEVEEIMGLFKLRTKKGLGIGAPGLVKANEDGIEAKVMALGKRAPAAKDLAKEAQAVEKAGYVAAAVAEVIEGKCPVDKKQGDKDPAEWKKWTKEMKSHALDLASAYKAKDGPMIKKAATSLNSVCNSCHSVFRD
jgi:hypothetical protein